jgi:glyoxylase-like metal-dependent hydrolase (beta-lactamase superfamily II)
LVLDEFDVRGAVIIGDNRIMVWDTLSHPRDMQSVAVLAAGKPIDVVYSHADWDHCWGTVGLAAETIVAHHLCAERFQSGDVKDSLTEKQAEQPGQWETVILMPPTVTFDPMLSLDLGSLTVELHHLPGHTEDCLVAWIPEWGVLLAGDTVETPLPYLNTNSVGLLHEWIAHLASWSSKQELHHVIPSHGDIGDRSVIDQTLAYLRDLQAGKSPTVSAHMTTFYTETHANNQALLKVKS